MATIPLLKQEGGDVSAIGNQEPIGFSSLSTDPELFGNAAFTPAPELTQSVVQPTIAPVVQPTLEKPQNVLSFTDAIAKSIQTGQEKGFEESLVDEQQGRMAGLQGYDYGLESQRDVASADFNKYLTENKIPGVIQDKEGNWWGLNAGPDVSVNLSGTDFEDIRAGQALGPVGSYSVPISKYAPPSGLDTLSTILATAGMFIPGGQALALIGPLTKAASGETLKTGDWANIVTGGLHATGMLVPPTEAIEATATAAAIPASAGQGLFDGISYADSIKGLNVAAAAAQGDFAGAVVSQFGDVLTEKALGGLEGKFLTDLKNNYNINSDDLIKGLVQSEKALVNGASLGEAMLQGVGKYITEGGSLGKGFDLQTPEVLKQLEDVVRTVGSAIDDTVLQPVKEAVPLLIDAAKEVTQPLIDVGSAVNKAVVKPVVSTVGEVAKKTGEVVQAVTEPVIDVVDDVLDSTYDALNQLDNFIDDIDLPNINLPNINLPRFNLGMDMSLLTGMGGGGGGYRPTQERRKQTPIDLQFELQEIEKLKQPEFIGRYL